VEFDPETNSWKEVYSARFNSSVASYLLEKAGGREQFEGDSRLSFRNFMLSQPVRYYCVREVRNGCTFWGTSAEALNYRSAVARFMEDPRFDTYGEVSDGFI